MEIRSSPENAEIIEKTKFEKGDTWIRLPKAGEVLLHPLRHFMNYRCSYEARWKFSHGASQLHPST